MGLEREAWRYEETKLKRDFGKLGSMYCIMALMLLKTQLKRNYEVSVNYNILRIVMLAGDTLFVCYGTIQMEVVVCKKLWLKGIQ